MLYDITRTITPQLHVWPGDTSFSLQTVLSKASGASVNLTTLTLSAHTGTHADAYFHYDDAGAKAATMPLAAYVGTARVISVAKRAGALTPDDFPAGSLDGLQRLLIHSWVSDLPDDQWPEAFPYLSVELIAYLAARGVCLIGLDSPSVDAFDSKDLLCHHALKRHTIVNIETLWLRDVPDGDYELIALPLKFEQACASPVRAVLRTISP